MSGVDPDGTTSVTAASVRGSPKAKKSLGTEDRGGAARLVLRTLQMASSSLWPRMLAVLVLALSGCNHTEDDPISSDQKVYGDMGLELTYHEATTSVRATVQRTLATDERLLLRVRRGRLSRHGEPLLDCNGIPAANPVGGETSPTGGPVYQGPQIERAILASVYSREWIERNLTEEQRGRLAREGSDAIVEACIVRGETALSRVQTSLPNAWDPADPNRATP